MKYYMVDAFTEQVFGGNPAGVCLLDAPLEAAVMQKIAFENNLSETAFLVKRDGYYDLKWFTPEVEIDLCGHATLASAFVLMNHVEPALRRVDFMTLSGKLTVTRDGDLYRMDFPSRMPAPCGKPALLEKALGVSVLETHMSRDLLALVGSEADVLNLKPDFALLGQLDGAFAVIVTAKGDDCDFVSRFFTLAAGIDEDPVTGSSHSTLIPFWSRRLGKTAMTARQLSRRGGTLYCKDGGDRVEIGGSAALYLEGEIRL
jgi:PhzF family phenazine biosynthesis protein